MVATHQPADPLILLGAAVMGAWNVYNGIRTWRGRELNMVRGTDASTGDPRWFPGGRRRYRTFFGGGLAGIPGGLAFLLIAVGLAVRDLLDKPVDWAPWYRVAVVSAVLMFVSVLYWLTYVWIGVPDALRPPSQRGQLAPNDPTGEKRRRHQRAFQALRRPSVDGR